MKRAAKWFVLIYVCTQVVPGVIAGIYIAFKFCPEITNSMHASASGQMVNNAGNKDGVEK